MTLSGRMLRLERKDQGRPCRLQDIDRVFLFGKRDDRDVRRDLPGCQRDVRVLGGRTIGEHQPGGGRAQLVTGDRLTMTLTAETVLAAGAELLVLGNREQRRAVAEAFET